MKAVFYVIKVKNRDLKKQTIIFALFSETIK
jgi:hypothetical protein